MSNKKIGDIISWECECKVYSAEVVNINTKEKVYNVYVDYPNFKHCPDQIPFECIINK